MSIVKILCIGDVVGKPGRKAVQALLPRLREEHNIGFAVVNGENSAAGAGLAPKIVEELLAAGADVITTGDHVYDNKDVFGCIDHAQLLRPYNYVPAARGKGYGVYLAKDGTRFAVGLLVGQVFMSPAESPFRAAEEMAARAAADDALLIIDVHAEATSEKIGLGRFLDGRAIAVVGTHTHVQTADEQILAKGTAFITDLGMTGSHDSIIGRVSESVLHRFTTQMPARFEVAENDVRLSGVVISCDIAAKRAVGIERIHIKQPVSE